MPAYFQLLSKASGKAVPFVEIDEAMCKHFQVDVDPVKYYEGWYDNIGLLCALGRTWDEIRETWKDFPELLAIVDWLAEHYTADGWSSR